ERRSHANVRRGLKPLIANPRASYINAMTGSEFGVFRQIDGGHGVTRAVAASRRGSSRNGKWTAKQVSCLADLPRDQESANRAAGNDFAARAHLGIDDDRESKLAAIFGKSVHVALCLMPKVETRAFVDFARVQPTGNDLLGECLWREGREAGIKGENQGGFHSGLREQRKLLRQRRDQPGGALGPQQPRGMRIKGYSQRMRAEFPCALCDTAQHVPMREMHAVEVANTDDVPVPVGWKFVDRPKYAHL